MRNLASLSLRLAAGCLVVQPGCQLLQLHVTSFAAFPLLAKGSCRCCGLLLQCRTYMYHAVYTRASKIWQLVQTVCPVLMLLWLLGISFLHLYQP